MTRRAWYFSRTRDDTIHPSWIILLLLSWTSQRRRSSPHHHIVCPTAEWAASTFRRRIPAYSSVLHSTPANKTTSQPVSPSIIIHLILSAEWVNQWVRNNKQKGTTWAQSSWNNTQFIYSSKFSPVFSKGTLSLLWLAGWPGLVLQDHFHSLCVFIRIPFCPAAVLLQMPGNWKLYDFSEESRIQIREGNSGVREDNDFCEDKRERRWWRRRQRLRQTT